jgi:hypothetical protein
MTLLCIGGPWDGQKTKDRGDYFEVQDDTELTSFLGVPSEKTATSLAVKRVAYFKRQVIIAQGKAVFIYAPKDWEFKFADRLLDNYVPGGWKIREAWIEALIRERGHTRRSALDEIEFLTSRVK